MKKTLAMLLALAMGCTMLVSCGDKDDESSKEEKKSTPVKPDFSAGITIEKEEAKETEDRLFEKLVTEIGEKKVCTMSVDVAEEGLAVKMYLTMDETNSYVDMDFLGIQIVMLNNADGSYILDTEAKKYYMDPTGSMSEQFSADDMLDEFSTLEGMTYISSATVTISGDEYPMETYKNEYESETSYIFDGAGDLVAVKTDDSEFMPFLLSTTADADKFSLDGYTEMTDEEFMAWSESLMSFGVEESEDEMIAEVVE